MVSFRVQLLSAVGVLMLTQGPYPRDWFGESGNISNELTIDLPSLWEEYGKKKSPNFVFTTKMVQTQKVESSRKVRLSNLGTSKRAFEVQHFPVLLPPQGPIRANGQGEAHVT